MPVKLEILRNYLNHDEKMVQKFLQLFCSAIPQDLNKLKQYMHESDFKLASVTAHSIKSQCAYLGLDLARLMAEKLENISQIGHEQNILFESLENILLSEIAEMKMTLNI
ncbi:MAG: Hpt domain-containing protein [Bacteroidetes bacterium]|nr:Hpt domain-containing protein [Bacteroidota bacterium]